MDIFSLKYKLFIFSIGLSLALTLMVSFFEVQHDIRTYKNAVTEELNHLKATHQKSLSNKMWAMDYESVATFVQDQMNNRLLDSLSVADHNGEVIATSGVNLRKNQITIRFNLTHTYNNLESVIGEVVAGSTIPGIKEEIEKRWATIFFINGLLITVIFTSSYLLFYRQVLTRLFNIISCINQDSKVHSAGKISPAREPRRKDEITLLIDSLNERTDRINKEFKKRLKAEAELKTSQQTFLSVLDGIDATVYVSDMDTYEVLFMNKYMVEEYGKDRVGQKCYAAFCGEPSPCSWCTNDQLIDTQGKPTGLCVWQAGNPVTKKHYINHDRAIEWVDGRIVRLQIATDISDLVKMEEQLRQVQKMESIGRLAGGVAHDFNNMLGIILGNTEILLDEIGNNDPIRKNVQDLFNATKRSINLTRQLLAFARKQAVSPRVLDLNETVDGMLKMLKRLIGEDIRLNWLPGKKLWKVRLDPTQVDQILANLLVNARDAIHDTGSITIETDNISLDRTFCSTHQGALPGPYVLLCVTDSGNGMDDETLSKLFEPFFTTKDMGEGTGLGLATVYGIIRQNNGIIDVQSELKKGTKFNIYLPSHEAEEQEPETQVSSAPSVTGNETILVVEDEELLLDMTKAVLTRLGYTVLTASGSQDALGLDAMKNQKIDLLMVDVIMPEMNGRDLAKRVQNIYPDIACLYMSGYSADVITTRGILGKDVNYIQKPFSKQVLATTIRKVLDT